MHSRAQVDVQLAADELRRLLQPQQRVIIHKRQAVLQPVDLWGAGRGFGGGGDLGPEGLLGGGAAVGCRVLVPGVMSRARTAEGPAGRAVTHRSGRRRAAASVPTAR